MFLDKDYLFKLLSLGYRFIASVVHDYYGYKYYNINSIQRIIDNNGHWIACNFGQHDVDWSVTVKLSDVRAKKI